MWNSQKTGNKQPSAGPVALPYRGEKMGKLKTLCRRLLFGYKADSAVFVEHLRKTGMRIGGGTVVYEPRSVMIDPTRPWLIEIGENVQITRGVTILTHGYDWSVLKGVYGEVLGSAGKVTIGNNVFIGMNAVILKGVTIGDNVIIGAGSLVNRDIPPNCVAAGNPARVIMTLEEYHEKRRAAQEREARELVREYRAVYGKEPGEEALSEFFWLFADSAEGLPSSWEEKLRLCGNRAFSAEALSRNEKRFGSMADFLKWCEKG